VHATATCSTSGVLWSMHARQATMPSRSLHEGPAPLRAAPRWCGVPERVEVQRVAEALLAAAEQVRNETVALVATIEAHLLAECRQEETPRRIGRAAAPAALIRRSPSKGARTAPTERGGPRGILG